MFGIKRLKEQVRELNLNVYHLQNPRKYNNGDIVWCRRQVSLEKFEKQEFIVCDYRVEQYLGFFGNYHCMSFYELTDANDLNNKTTSKYLQIESLSKRKIEIK
jgi:hypothetical protein